MKKTIMAVVLCMVMVLGAPVAMAEPMETLAKQAILVDADTGTILFDKAGGDRMPTSSMSKVMTMYMVFEDLKRGHISLTDELTISERAWRMEGSKMFIKVGDKVKVEDLVRGVIVQSGNDATVALAEGVAGSEQAFVDAMNVRAKEIGLTDSNFMNASGWPDPEHYSTSRDLAILAYRLIKDFPDYYHYYAEKEYTYNKIKQQNRNPLLSRLSGADGVKTGHTEVAGYGLIGSAVRDGRRLIMVVNGLPDEKARADESVRLMEWGFRNFESKKIIAAGEAVESARVWLGESVDVPMAAAQDVSVLLPKARRSELKLTVQYKEPLKAPLKKGDKIGVLKVEVPDQPMFEVDLLAGSDVARKGVFGRAADRMGYLLTGAY